MNSPKKLTILPEDVRSKLRSGIAISSIVQCVEELVLNSIDAEATCIAIRIDISAFKIQIIDNGTGISLDQFQLLGERYATNKHVNGNILGISNQYGHRGEALANIRNMISVERASFGTSVTVLDLMYNLPVRRKIMNETLSMEQTRRCIEALAIIHPNISFTLRNDRIGSVLIQTKRSSNPIDVFSCLYGESKKLLMKTASIHVDNLKITGFIGTEGHQNKNLQFVYVNKRYLLKSKIHKLINSMCSKTTIGRITKLGNFSTNFETQHNYFSQMNFASSRSIERWCIFSLNYECNPFDYDIILDPDYSKIEFKNWNTVLDATQKLLSKFIVDNNLSNIYESERDKSAYPVTNEFTNEETVSQLPKLIEENSHSTSLLPNSEYSRDCEELFTNHNPIVYKYQKRKGIVEKTTTDSHNVVKIKEIQCEKEWTQKDKSKNENTNFVISEPVLTIDISEDNTNRALMHNTKKQTQSKFAVINSVSPAFHNMMCSSGKSTASDLATLESSQKHLQVSDQAIVSEDIIKDCDDEAFNGQNAVDDKSERTDGNGSNKCVDNSLSLSSVSSATELFKQIDKNKVGLEEITSNDSELNNDKINQLNPWITGEDEFGKTIYINSISGNSSYTLPSESVEILIKDRISDQIKNDKNRLSVCPCSDLEKIYQDVNIDTDCLIYEEDKEKEVECLIDIWNNPIFLSNKQVLGQIDKKFIICVATSTENANSNNLLILFDQHAVHERIKVEQLFKDAFEEGINGHKILKSVTLQEPLSIYLEEENIRVLQHYKSRLLTYGIDILILNENSIKIITIPKCIYDKDVNELKHNRSSIIHDSVSALLKDEINLLEVTHGSKNTLPKFVWETLSSKACRTAIKFGDELCFEDCENLIKLLTECRLPFQCAHGRPSFTPLLNLEDLKFYKRKKVLISFYSFLISIITFCY
ncbi:DNA mismatch repair protein Mlh3 [Nymphon striatum]|nr:DNA mismatch repair protein Mlh3 [Nymphon striatum]